MLHFRIQVLNGWYDSYNINTKLGEIIESIRRFEEKRKKERREEKLIQFFSIKWSAVKSETFLM